MGSHGGVAPRWHSTKEKSTLIIQIPHTLQFRIRIKMLDITLLGSREEKMMMDKQVENLGIKCYLPTSRLTVRVSRMSLTPRISYLDAD